MLKRILVILLVLAISAGIAFGLDAAFNGVSRKNHPKDYSEQVEKYAKEYNIPEYVIYAVIKVESDFDPNARSSAGACGLMQMMPETFLWLTGSSHLDEGLTADALFDPEVSIRYGSYYLLYLYRKFGYNWDTAFAAYNAGEGNVAKWLKDSEYSDGNGNLTNIPFPETKSYVKKVNSAIDTYKKLYYQGESR